MAHAAHGIHTDVPAWIEPMLAKPDGGRLPTVPGVAYELDGFRAAMRIAPDGATVLTSRAGNDFTHEFADLLGERARPDLGGQAAVLDWASASTGPCNGLSTVWRPTQLA